MAIEYYMDMMKENMGDRMSDVAVRSTDGNMIKLFHPDCNLEYRESGIYERFCDIPDGIKYIFPYDDCFCAFRNYDELVMLNMRFQHNPQGFYSWKINTYMTMKWDGTFYTIRGDKSFLISARCTDCCGMYVPHDNFNKPVSSRMEALLFFGGPVCNPYVSYFDMNTFKLPRFFSLRAIKEMEISRCGMFHLSCGTERWMMPQEVYAYTASISDACETMRTYCILDYQDDAPVARFFFYMHFPKGDERIENFEYMRLRFHELFDLYLSSLSPKVIWIDERVKDMFPYLPSPDASYGFHIYALLLENPLAGEMFSYDKRLFFEFVSDALEMSCSVTESFPSVLGKIYEGRGLFKKIGMPEYMVRAILTDYERPFKRMRDFKYMFDSYPDYLKCLDEKKFRIIAECLFLGLYEEGISCVRKLVDMNGPKDSIQYVRYVSQHDNHEQHILCRYYSMMECADYRIREFLVWNESVYMAEHITGIMSQGIDFYDRIFKKNHSLWQQHEYHKDGFSICAPESPAEFFKEGYFLRHCVVSFIPSCADNLTEILFLRRDMEQTKPYLTLEVRDGSIRQCHGFANSNISSLPESSEITLFLQEFCNEKGIEYRNPDMPYHA